MIQDESISGPGIEYSSDLLRRVTDVHFAGVLHVHDVLSFCQDLSVVIERTLAETVLKNSVLLGSFCILLAQF